MRIAIVTSSERDTGGVATWNAVMAATLRRDLGHRVDFYSDDSVGNRYSIDPKLELPDTVSRHVQSLRGSISYDAIICNGHYGAFIEPPAIIVFHGTYFWPHQLVERLNPKRQHQIQVLRDRQMDAAKGKFVVAISERVKQELVNAGILPQRIIPLGVCTKTFSFFTSKPDSHAIAVARYVPVSKGIEILEEIAAAGVQVRLFSNLSSPPSTSLLQWHKFTTWANLAFEYRRARCLLHPSFYEGAPYVVLEAMASGCPVVMRDVGLATELSRSLPEYVVEYQASAQDFVDAMTRVDGRRNELCWRGKEYIDQKHSPERHAEMWNEVLNLAPNFFSATSAFTTGGR